MPPGGHGFDLRAIYDPLSKVVEEFFAKVPRNLLAVEVQSELPAADLIEGVVYIPAFSSLTLCQANTVTQSVTLSQMWPPPKR